MHLGARARSPEDNRHEHRLLGPPFGYQRHCGRRPVAEQRLLRFDVARHRRRQRSGSDGAARQRRGGHDRLRRARGHEALHTLRRSGHDRPLPWRHRCLRPQACRYAQARGSAAALGLSRLRLRRHDVDGAGPGGNERRAGDLGRFRHRPRQGAELGQREQAVGRGEDPEQRRALVEGSAARHQGCCWRSGHRRKLPGRPRVLASLGRRGQKCRRPGGEPVGTAHDRQQIRRRDRERGGARDALTPLQSGAWHVGGGRPALGAHPCGVPAERGSPRGQGERRLFRESGRDDETARHHPVASHDDRRQRVLSGTGLLLAGRDHAAASQEPG